MLRYRLEGNNRRKVRRVVFAGLQSCSTEGAALLRRLKQEKKMYDGSHANKAVEAARRGMKFIAE